MKYLFKALLGASLLSTAILLGTNVSIAAQPAATTAQSGKTIRFEITLPDSRSEAGHTGRLFLFVARSNKTEPRLQSDAVYFGLDVRSAKSGKGFVIDETILGFPSRSLNDLEPGKYYVQALLNVYTEFRRADGHTVWAHMDQWEGQNFRKSPGNFVSEPQAITIEKDKTFAMKLDVKRELPRVEPPKETEWVKYVKIQSKLLTAFWGRPMFIGATILLPKGYDTHPEAQYPVVYVQGHFNLNPPYPFSTTPPKNGEKSWARKREEAAAKGLPPPTPPAGTKLIGSLSNTENGYEFYQSWTADDFPRVIAVTFQHPTPYLENSYGVNSPNCGPYGDALVRELIPELERRFRMIKKPYARMLTGNSTGGWGSLALQLYYPDDFGGTWSFSPDPVDFRRYYGGVNIYEEDNAFVEKPGRQNENSVKTLRKWSQKAAVIGTLDSDLEWWKHTPTGPDGYPMNVWDLSTGKINRAVAEKMRASNFDLRDFLARNWTTLGPKLIGKIHVYAADTDVYYTQFAVPLLEEFMRNTKNPHDAGSFKYGPLGSPHGWRETTHAKLIKTIAEHVVENAPAGENTAQWHYR